MITPHRLRTLSPWIYVIIFLPVALFAGLMCYKVLPYLSFGRTVNFLSTKTDATLNNLTFRIGFYVHITTSCIVLIAGIPQFLPWVARRYKSVHRILGKVYVVGIIVFAAISGFVLAMYANGGLPAKTGFALQCIAWWGATFMAYKMVMEKNYREHIAWMIRSFAITLAAFSLRTETWVLHNFFNTGPIETYVTITWLSWVGNLFIAEILIAFGLDRYLHQQIIKPTI